MGAAEVSSQFQTMHKPEAKKMQNPTAREIASLNCVTVYDFLNEEKPKGMHWRTFERLVQEYKRFNAASWFALARRYRLDLPAGE
jgi:hypothetical protein